MVNTSFLVIVCLLFASTFCAEVTVDLSSPVSDEDCGLNGVACSSISAALHYCSNISQRVCTLWLLGGIYPPENNTHIDASGFNLTISGTSENTIINLQNESNFIFGTRSTQIYLNNLTIINGKINATDASATKAIIQINNYDADSILSITDCKFYNHTIESNSTLETYTSIIQIRGSSLSTNPVLLELTNSRFENNTLRPVLNMNGQMNIIRTTFRNTHNEDGVIYSLSDEYLINGETHTLSISHCEFEDNILLTSGKSDMAIIKLQSVSSPAYYTLDNNDFTNNHVQVATGSLINYSRAQLVLNHCNFVGNSGSRMGMVYSVFNSYIVIENCLFQDSYTFNGVDSGNCSANFIFFSDIFIGEISGCQFINNCATSFFIPVVNLLRLVSTTFDGNLAVPLKLNGNENSTVSVIDSVFINSVSDDYGGAVYLHSSNSPTTQSLPTFYIYNCEFINNTAPDGAAIFLHNWNLFISAATFANNTASDYGGAIYCATGYIEVYINTEFRNNYPDDFFCSTASCNFSGNVYPCDTRPSHTPTPTPTPTPSPPTEQDQSHRKYLLWWVVIFGVAWCLVLVSIAVRFVVIQNHKRKVIREKIASRFIVDNEDDDL